MSLDQTPVTRMESRWISAITAIAMFLGAWWLQNQYTATLRLQEAMQDYMRYSSETYVAKDYLTRVENRLDRIESKIDALSDKAKIDRH